MTAKWEDITRKGVLVSSEIKLGGFHLSVHRHIHYPPDVWLTNCYPGLFDNYELPSKDITVSKNLAISKLESCLRVALNEIDNFDYSSEV